MKNIKSFFIITFAICLFYYSFGWITKGIVYFTDKTGPKVIIEEIEIQSAFIGVKSSSNINTIPIFDANGGVSFAFTTQNDIKKIINILLYNGEIKEIYLCDTKIFLNQRKQKLIMHTNIGKIFNTVKYELYLTNGTL